VGEVLDYAWLRLLLNWRRGIGRTSAARWGVALLAANAALESGHVAVVARFDAEFAGRG
jgi:hypothetical protein